MNKLIFALDVTSIVLVLFSLSSFSMGNVADAIWLGVIALVVEEGKKKYDL